MRSNKIIYSCRLISILLGIWGSSCMLHAAEPDFSTNPVFFITPISKAPSIVYAGQVVTATYTIQNNPRNPYPILYGNGVVDLPPGVRVIGGTCAFPAFNLARAASCTVQLQITADELKGNITSGPKVCNSLIHPIHCSVPSSANALNVIKDTNLPPLTTTTIGTTPPAVFLTQGGSIQTVVITNNGSVAAYNVSAVVNMPSLGVSITRNTCSTVLPNSPPANTCEIDIAPGNTIGNTTVSISGTNTNTIAEPVTVSSAPPTTLSAPPTAVIPVNDITGVNITVTNTGAAPAINVRVDLSATGWSDVESSTCPVTNAGDSCILTLTSTTNTPYIAQNNIPITGDNIVTPPTIALAFSMQGYLVFAVDGSTNTATVVDTTNIANNDSWDTSGTPQITGAQSLTDGTANTLTIVSQLGTSTNYAARDCNESTRGGASVGSWYLPAICQMGTYDSSVGGTDAGCNPATQNMVTNLYKLGFLSDLAVNVFWSSTENTTDPQFLAWTQIFVANSDSSQSPNTKPALFDVRCVQNLNY